MVPGDHWYELARHRTQRLETKKMSFGGRQMGPLGLVRTQLGATKGKKVEDRESFRKVMSWHLIMGSLLKRM